MLKNEDCVREDVVEIKESGGFSYVKMSKCAKKKKKKKKRENVCTE